MGRGSDCELTPDHPVPAQGSGCDHVRVTSDLPPDGPHGSAAAENTRRIGTAEREHAMNSLDTHLSAGRLDPDEYAERAARASVARTAGELTPLFSDLPEPGPLPVSSAPTRPSAPGSPPAVVPAGHRALGGRAGTTAVAIMPFVALALFFLVGHWDYAWLFFLLIPATAIIVYGADHDHDHDHARDRHRKRDR